MTDDYPQILKTDQVAELLGMNVDMVRKAAREGTLPAYRLPGERKYRFFKYELLEWLRSHPTGPSTTRPPSPDLESAPQPGVPATPSVVQQAVRAAIPPDRILHTPVRRVPFTVKTIDTDGVVLLLGRMKNPVRLTWACLEGVVPFIENHGGDLPIGGQHTVEGQPGTLDEYLKACTKVNTARWVGALLEAAGIVEIVRERPSRVRLRL